MIPTLKSPWTKWGKLSRQQLPCSPMPPTRLPWWGGPRSSRTTIRNLSHLLKPRRETGKCSSMSVWTKLLKGSCGLFVKSAESETAAAEFRQPPSRSQQGGRGRGRISAMETLSVLAKRLILSSPEEEMTRTSYCMYGQFFNAKYTCQPYVVQTKGMGFILPPHTEVSLKVAGRLANTWRVLTRDNWVLQAIKGFQIPFVGQPVLERKPRVLSFSLEQLAQIQEEVSSLLEKGAVTVVDSHSPKQSSIPFSSWSPRKMGKWGLWSTSKSSING